MMSTIKDVARESGLSVGTVSRVLNGRGYLSQEAKDRVQAAMHRLGYEPNALARSLSKSTSRIVAIIMPMLDNPFFSELLMALTGELSQRGYQSLLFVCDSPEGNVSLFIRECMRNRVAGIILCSGALTSADLGELAIPVVTLERGSLEKASRIKCDNRLGGRLAAEHLIARGCVRLLALSAPQGRPMPGDERLETFIETCRQAGVECIGEVLEPGLFHSQDYTASLEEVLSRHQDADGLFCTSDILALQAMGVARKLGRRIPEDLKVVGFDGTKLARTLRPSLTTVAQPTGQMARLAVESILEAARPSSVRVDMTVDVRLVEGDSTMISV